MTITIINGEYNKYNVVIRIIIISVTNILNITTINASEAGLENVGWLDIMVKQALKKSGSLFRKVVGSSLQIIKFIS